MFRTRTAGNASAVDQPVRASRRQRRRDATGSGLATGTGWLARVIHVIVTIVVVIIVAGILLVVLKANPTNSIVSQLHDWARTLAGPFDGIFSFHNANITIAVNWGIAAVVYLFVGGLIARLLSRTHH